MVGGGMWTSFLRQVKGGKEISCSLPNLKDILCRAKLPPKRSHIVRTQAKGQRIYKKPSCRKCPYTGLQPGQIRESITISHSGEKIKSSLPLIAKPQMWFISYIVWKIHRPKLVKHQIQAGSRLASSDPPNSSLKKWKKLFSFSSFKGLW